jgi:long-chain acyl-CoA synthetase
MALGIGKGDTIANHSSSRPECNSVDMGILQTGAVHVPVYPTISEADYRYILSHGGVKLIFV